MYKRKDRVESDGRASVQFFGESGIGMVAAQDTHVQAAEWRCCMSAHLRVFGWQKGMCLIEWWLYYGSVCWLLRNDVAVRKCQVRYQTTTSKHPKELLCFYKLLAVSHQTLTDDC